MSLMDMGRSRSTSAYRSSLTAATMDCGRVQGYARPVATVERALALPRSSALRGSVPVALLAALLSVVALHVPIGGSGTAPTGAPARPAVSDLGATPLGFAPNRGQSSPRVRFLAQGPGYGIFLTPGRAVLSLERTGARGAALALGFVGADPDPAIAGSGREGTTSYLGGGGGALHVPGFAGVRYRGLWPGVGMRFYGTGGHLEYDFELAAGADPRRIGLRFAGQRELRLAAAGSLLLRLGGRPIRQLPPHAFQTIGSRRVPVASHYTLGPGGRIGIALGRYDHTLPLTIDPRLVYSTYLGAGVLGWATSVAVGPEGDAYLTGSTPRPTFPHTVGTFPAKKNRSAFVTKLDPERNRIVYSTFVGGAAGSHGGAIAVDRKGDAFVAGRANADDFHTHGAYMPKQAGPKGIFVAELDPGGGHLDYSAYLGRRGGESGVVGLAIDPAGNAYVAGMTTSQKFPTSADALIPTDPRTDPIAEAGFVAKLNRSGSKLVYSTYLAGTGGFHDPLGGIAVDSRGHAYITGWSESGDFPTTHGAYETSLKPPYHEGIFVTKLNRAGSGLVYSTFLSGGQNEEGEAIAVDRRGRAYITGYTESRRYPITPGAYQPQMIGSQDIVVSILSADGRDLEASTYLGGKSADGLAAEGTGIGLEPDGDVVISGITNTAGFKTTANALQPRPHSRYYDNSVVAELTPDLRRVPYLSYFSGRSVTHVRGLAIGPGGGVFVAGGSNPGLTQTAAHLPRFHDPHERNHSNAFAAEFEL
jgi:hypothetical protein